MHDGIGVWPAARRLNQGKFVWPKDACTTLSLAADIKLELRAGAALVEQAEAIVQAVVGGRIAPDIGAQLVAALGGLGALREHEELERRIAALEAAKAG